MSAGSTSPTPFALSLSKGFSSRAAREGEGFDKLSPNGTSLRHNPLARFEARR
jgi:hypothetical protein